MQKRYGSITVHGYVAGCGDRPDIVEGFSPAQARRIAAAPRLHAVKLSKIVAPRLKAPQRRPRERGPRARSTRGTKQARAPGREPDEPSEPSCARCGASLADKRRGALTCSHTCAEALRRARAKGDSNEQLLQRYRDEIAKARKRGDLTEADALELLISPSPRVLAMLADAA
jgi:hypothetical protein